MQIAEEYRAEGALGRRVASAQNAELPLVGIVIPVWNAVAYTLACLESLAGLRYPRFEVVVVDNGSADGTAEAVREGYPAVALICNERNMGFAHACNQGLAHVFARGAEFALLLNNDTLVAPDMLLRLVEAARSYPDAGILGPKICYADRPEVPWFTGIRFRGQIYIVRTASPKHQVQSEVPAAVDFISGCGMLIRRAVYDAIGGLSEDYFMYYEDLDFCFQAKHAGFGVIYAPDARMWHALSVSSGGKDSPLKQYFQIKSSMIFYRRHTHGIWRVLNLSIRFTHAIYTATRHLLRGNLRWETIREYIRGIRESAQMGTATAPARRQQQ